jgi:2-methylcitrate dehydratase PrpD
MSVPSADESVYSELSLKPFCSSKQSIASVEALKEILSAGIEADAISAVVVRVPPPYANMIRIKAVSGVRSSTLVSVAHQLAMAAYEPDGLYDVDRSRPITDSRLAKFASKVDIVADPSLMPLYPSSWPAELEVTAGGRVVTRRVTATIGDPGHVLSDEDVERKAHRVLDGALGSRAVKDWLQVIHRRHDDAKGYRTFVERIAEDALGWSNA